MPFSRLLHRADTEGAPGKRPAIPIMAMLSCTCLVICTFLCRNEDLPGFSGLIFEWLNDQLRCYIRRLCSPLTSPLCCKLLPGRARTGIRHNVPVNHLVGKMTAEKRYRWIAEQIRHRDFTA